MNHSADVATYWTYFFGMATAVFGAFTIQEWAAITGIALGVATFAANVYFKRQMMRIEHRRFEKEHGESVDAG